MLKLYPLKFRPIFVEKVWGGDRLKKVLNKNIPSDKTGESWEISAVQDFLSIVDNGILSMNNIQELIEVFMGELVGEQIYLKYGIEFPLLIKFIDANDILSVQVHPDDHIAKHRHYAYGKTEMWYVIDAEPDAEIIVGFNQEIDKNILLESLEKGEIVKYLQKYKVKPGDVFFIPPGTVHALGKGILVAEIQQTSDITYRLYDWGRVGLDGKPRDLHIDLAVDVLDYKPRKDYKRTYEKKLNERSLLVSCQYFTTNLIEFDKQQDYNYSGIDSFVIYMCLDGEFEIDYQRDEPILVKKGETVLIPADLDFVSLIPHKKSKILEVFLPNAELNEQEILDKWLSGDF